jgi:hypothetical protein
MNTTTTTFDFPRAVEAAIEYVEERGAVTFMELHDHLAGPQFGRIFSGEETMTIGHHSIGNGVTMTPMSDPPNVVLWNCGSPELLAVIEAMLADGRVVIERTSVELYRGEGMVLLEDYDEDQDDYKEVRLPALDFSEESVAEIDPAGYDTPHWVPVMFAWAG